MDIKKLERELDLKEMQIQSKSDMTKERLEQHIDSANIKCQDGTQFQADIYTHALEEIQKIVASQP